MQADQDDDHRHKASLRRLARSETAQLYDFEEWLFSDDWKGGGEHPNLKNIEQDRRLVRRAVQ